MARGIPCSSRSLTFFHSSIPRGIDYVPPRILKVLGKIPRGPRNCWNSFFEHLNVRKNKNVRKFSEICWDCSLFIHVFQDYQSILGIIAEHSELWKSMLIFSLNFSTFFSDFWDNLFLEIPRGPRGIDFTFLDPRRMEFCNSLIPRFLEEWNSPRNWHP